MVNYQRLQPCQDLILVLIIPRYSLVRICSLTRHDYLIVLHLPNDYFIHSAHCGAKIMLKHCYRTRHRDAQYIFLYFFIAYFIGAATNLLI